MSVATVDPVLWTAREAREATGGVALGADWRATGVSIDTRGLRRGDLFVALRGKGDDGHAWVGAAFAAGAAAALVSDGALTPEAAGGPLLRVSDTLSGIGALGRAARARATARVVAVTGSVGKTSTKDALRHVLSRQASTHAATSSFNNHIGVPVTLARMPRDARYAVIEIGTNHPGEIEPLARTARPDVAVVTTIAAAHLGNFGSLDAIAREKSRIFAGMAGGVAILESDGAQVDFLRSAARAQGAGRIATFGEDATADVRLIDCRLDENGSDVSALVSGTVLRYRVGAAGRHWVRNSMAVLAVVDCVGGDVAAAARDLASVEAPAGRGARRPVAIGGGVAELVDESWNASPTSVRATLATLAMRSGGRRVLVLGDMLELGPDAVAMHVGLAPDIRAAGVDVVFGCGPMTERLLDALPGGLRGGHAPDSGRLAQRVVEALRPGDIVVVKGSLGSKMKVVVDAIVALDAARSGRKG